MRCSEVFASGFDVAQSGLVLIGATAYRIILFMIFLSASIAPSVMLTRVYDSLTGLDPLPEVVEAMICMILIRCWAEFAVGIEPRVCGDTLDSYRRKYPNTMTFGRFSVNLILYMGAFCQLYIQFEESHTTAPSKISRHTMQLDGRDTFRQYDLSEEENGAAPSGSPGLHTALFLLSMAYLVYTTSKTFHKNVIRVVQDVPSPYSILSNCMIRIGYAILHLTVNAVYFLPCIALAYTARTYKTDGHVTYFQLACTAAMCGMIAALFEMNKPWPRKRGQMPFLHFENNLITKDKLTVVLVGFILIAYYRPFRHGKVPRNTFDSSNSDLINFCMSVGFTVLHVVKSGVHAVLTLAHDYDVGRDQIGHLPPPELADLVLVPESNDVHQGSSSSSPGLVLEHDQMCPRCTENAINNNNAGHVLTQVRSPNCNNHDDELPPPPEEGSHEISSAVEPDETLANFPNQQKIVINNEQVVGEGPADDENNIVILNMTEVDLKHSQSSIV